MTNVSSFQLGDLQTNTYIIESDGEAVIIDPADDANFITEEVLRRRLRLLSIIGTHGHFDHMLAVGELQANFNIPYYLDARDTFLIQRTHETARHFLGYEPVFIPPRLISPLPLENLKLGTFSLQLMHTPGHTPGSVSLYLPDEGCLFTGDTLFFGSIGRTDFSYAKPKQMKTSLESIFRLPPETIVYPGHGEITSVGAEKKHMRTYFQLLER